jgi:transcriptional regulator GlxA family with amidase domain
MAVRKLDRLRRKPCIVAPAQAWRGMLSVGFVLLPDFTLTPFAAVVDVLRLAADDGDRSRPLRARWVVLGDGPVRSSAGAVIAADERAGDPARFSHIVLCGGLLKGGLLHGGRHDPPVPPGLQDAALGQWLHRAHAAGVTLVALCTASFTLARAGLLDGRRACVSWFHHAEFAADFPAVAVTAARMFVADGGVVTCAGGAGAIDVGAWMVRETLGPAAARKALDILLAPARTGDAPQPHGAGDVQTTDAVIAAALLRIEQRLAAPPGVAALARAAGLSRRQFERRFAAATGAPPHQWIAHRQMAQARWLMATTPASLTVIAGEAGFADAAHFSRRYRAQFGISPSVDRPALDAAMLAPAFRAGAS